MPTPDRSPALSEPWPPAWWLWVTAQAATLAGYAAGVRPSGGYPLPVADTADLGLAVVQMILATLLGRVLLETPHRHVQAACPAVIYATLAALLARRSVAETAALNAVTGAWLLAIPGLVRCDLGRLVLTFATIAGPVLFYLSAEYGHADARLSRWPALASPVLGVCSTRLPTPLWRALIVPLTIGGVILAVRTANNRRRARGKTR